MILSWFDLLILTYVVLAIIDKIIRFHIKLILINKMNYELDKGSSEIRGGYEPSIQGGASKMVKRNNRVKPKFFKLLGQIMNSHMEVS
jgi:hypothetical protein